MEIYLAHHHLVAHLQSVRGKFKCLKKKYLKKKKKTK